MNYESTNFQNMLKLVQMITNFGGTYIKKGSMADIFVKQDSSFVDEEGKPNHCTRYDYVLKAIEKDKKDIKVLEFDEFLSLLGIDNKKLNEMPSIDVEYLVENKYKR